MWPMVGRYYERYGRNDLYGLPWIGALPHSAMLRDIARDLPAFGLLKDRYEGSSC